MIHPRPKQTQRFTRRVFCVPSSQPWDVNEYLEKWGPVRFRFSSSGGHTSITVERNLLEFNGRVFNRGAMVILDSLPVGVMSREVGKARGGGSGERISLIRLFRSRTLDGRMR